MEIRFCPLTDWVVWGTLETIQQIAGEYRFQLTDRCKVLLAGIFFPPLFQYFVDVPSMPVELPEDTPVGGSFMNCAGNDDDTPLELTGHVMYDIIGTLRHSIRCKRPRDCSMV